jgi:hypothetical protein
MTDYTTLVTIGTTAGSMVNFESLTDSSGLPFPGPYVRFWDYVEAVTNLDGSKTALGLPHFTLDFGLLTVAQRDVIKAAYCSNAMQSQMYVSVPTNNNNSELKTYLAWLNWPVEGDVTRESAQLQKFVIDCTEAVLQT